MKSLFFKTPKSLLLCCNFISLSVFVFATTKALSIPSTPGRPECTNIQKTSCNISFLRPINDGGTPITKYYIEYRDCCSLKWKFIGTSTTTSYKVKNMHKRTYIQFRERAENKIGVGEASLNCDPRLLRDPYEE